MAKTSFDPTIALGKAIVDKNKARLQRDRLADLVLMFHHGGPWTDDQRLRWTRITGEAEATTKVLADYARKVRGNNG